jgi:hypothetical protein
VKIKTLYTCCEQVGRRGKDYEAKRFSINYLGDEVKKKKKKKKKKVGGTYSTQ